MTEDTPPATDANPPAGPTAAADAAPPGTPSSSVPPPSRVAPASPGAPDRALPSRGAAALAGVIAAGAALATGELVAALTAGTPSPLIAVGTAVIDFAPPGSKEVIVALFGTNNKIAVNLLVAATVLAAGAVIGLLARRSTLLASLLIVGLVGVGTAASLRDPTATQTFVLLSAALQVAAGLLVLEFLLDAARPRVSADGSPIAPDTVRRGFLVRAGVLGALALVGQGIGRAMLDARAASAASAVVSIPETVDPAPSIAPENAFDIEGITPLVIANEDFYRIDTALIVPTVDVDAWTLRVHGMVDREVTLTFAQLVELPLIERYVTIACVSNEVGGDLIGNAKWTGVRLTDVLDMAGVQAGATQIVPRSVDGWEAGFPTEWVTAPERPRDALIAVKMNDEPLPAANGFPARLIVPGLYGYVSATKWLKEIELTTWEAFDSYWVPRGWAKEAPILTQSRIDLPRPNAQHRQGDTVQVAGVAWAVDRAISKVEVRVDDGEWQPATLTVPLGSQTWLQWRFTWPAVAGRHTFWVRATDGEGVVQEERVTRPDPDGARGYHSVSVQVD